MKLIDKDALVAEIERIKEMYCYDTKTNASFVAEAVINSINNAINSIEVKEMDLQEGPKTEWLQELQNKLDSLSKEDFEEVMAKYRRYGEEGSVNYDKLNTMLEESLSKETKESWNKRLGEEEPVSEDLEKMSYHSAMDLINNPKFLPTTTFGELIPMLQKLYKDGAQWQKENLWKPADGDDLPEIDREVIAILDYDFGHYKVVYAHRPNPNGWNGTNIDTGEKEHFEPEIYGKGGWNQPHVLYWLDARLPYEENKFIKEL